MASSSERSPLITIGLSILTFVILDTLVFRSGLYTPYLTIHSIQGNIVHMVRTESERLPTGRREVLITGNSHMNSAFDVQEFQRLYPNSNLKILRASRFGIWLRPWYYILNKVDPNHNRYAAIVIPIDGYHPTPVAHDFKNLFVDQQVLAPILSLSEWMELVRDYSDTENRRQGNWTTLVAGHIYGPDFQNFLLKPFSRFVESKHILEEIETGMHEPPPYFENISDLVVDVGTKTIIHKPAHFSSNRNLSIEVEEVLSVPGALSLEQATTRFTEYETKWLRRIVELYRGSPTKLIFVYMPSRPYNFPSLIPLSTAVDLREILPHWDNIVFTKEEKYRELESPKLFYDIAHLNRDGAKIYTRFLSDDLVRVLQ